MKLTAISSFYVRLKELHGYTYTAVVKEIQCERGVPVWDVGNLLWIRLYTSNLQCKRF